MKFIVKILIFQLLFISGSFAKVDKVVDRFYSSLESFLEENFENTDFSIKKIESIKPEIGIQTFKIFSEGSSDLSFFQGSLFLETHFYLYCLEAHSSVLWYFQLIFRICHHNRHRSITSDIDSCPYHI